MCIPMRYFSTGIFHEHAVTAHVHDTVIDPMRTIDTHDIIFTRKHYDNTTGRQVGGTHTISTAEWQKKPSDIFRDF